MITKERLKALISNQSVIYYLGRAYWSDESRTHIVKHKLTSARVKALGGFDEILNDEYFFEHKEDAQFKSKYGCITRTQSISLPSFNELVQTLENAKWNGFFVISEFDNFNFEVLLSKEGPKIILLTGHADLPFTKENYIELCKKVAELYKGE